MLNMKPTEQLESLASAFAQKCDPLNQTLEKQADIRQGYKAGFNEAISQMQPEWVACKHKDKMPVGAYILLLEKDGFQSECIFRVSEKEHEREIPYFYVTHLVRLPQPPTK